MTNFGMITGEMAFLCEYAPGNKRQLSKISSSLENPFELNCQQPKLFSEFETSAGSVSLRTDMKIHDVIQCLYMILMFINIKNLQISRPVDIFVASRHFYGFRSAKNFTFSMKKQLGQCTLLKCILLYTNAPTHTCVVDFI